MENRNKTIYDLLARYKPDDTHPIVVDEKNEIYNGSDKNFIDLIAFLHGKTYQNETPMDMLSGANLKILKNIDYDVSYNDLDEKDINYLNKIFEINFSQNTTINELASIIFFDYLNSKYKNDDEEELSGFVRENLDSIREIAEKGELFNLINSISKRVDMVDEIYNFKNKSETKEWHRLDNLMPFEIGIYEDFVDRVDKKDKTFKNEQGKDVSYTEKTLYISNKKLQEMPFLKNLIDREFVYLYACSENSDLNKISGGQYLINDLKNDPNAKFVHQIGNQRKTYSLCRYNRAVNAYYIYTDFLSPEYMQQRGLIGKDIDSLKKYESQINQLKSRWLSLSISIPSPEQQIQELLGDYNQKGNRLATYDDKKGNSHIQTNEKKPYISNNAGLFNAESGYTIYDFKDQKIYRIKNYDTIKCLTMPGFGTTATTYNSFQVDLSAREEIIKKQAEKQAEAERLQEQKYLEKAQELTKLYNSLPNNKNEFKHEYFRSHGVDNVNQKCIMKFRELPKYEDQNQTVLCPCVPFFGIDENKRIKLYTLENIIYYKKDDDTIAKFKQKEKDARAKGTFSVAGVDNYSDLVKAIENQKSIYIAEGFATALAINKITNDICLSAGSIGNFVPIVKSLRDVRPDLNLSLCIDNDCFKYLSDQINVSISKIALYLQNNDLPDNINIFVPKFFETDKKGSDWADKLVNDNNIDKTRQDFINSKMTAQEFQSNQIKLLSPLKQNDLNQSEKLSNGNRY